MPQFMARARRVNNTLCQWAGWFLACISMKTSLCVLRLLVRSMKHRMSNQLPDVFHRLSQDVYVSSKCSASVCSLTPAILEACMGRTKFSVQRMASHTEFGTWQVFASVVVSEFAFLVVPNRCSVIHVWF